MASCSYIYYIYTTPSASRVFALVEGRKKPPAQVAQGQGDRAPVLIGMQWGTTMNASTVYISVIANGGAHVNLYKALNPL